VFLRTTALLLTVLAAVLATAPAPHAHPAAASTASPADSAWGGSYIPPGPK
jgi:hypothetical protein